MAVFLDLNGLSLIADEVEVVQVILSLAAGELDEAGLGAWVAQRTRPRSDPAG
jgi:prophage maintenance system killer protein